MGNSNSSPPPEPKEEENDIDFNETTTEAPPPVEPRADPDITENVEGSSTYSEYKVTSDFDEIRDAIHKKSEEEGKSYVYRDVDFPSETKSLYYTSRAPANWRDIEWKRPKDISSSPRLTKDGTSSEDIRQGMLGNCWFLASCAAISRSPKYLKKVIPEDQVMQGADYVGMFHFRFWRFGKWVDVIVDDALPTIRGSLCFGKSSDRSEFWLPLVEKAYAKLHNSYQAIEGGFTQDGMEDLTGGIVMSYDLGNKTPDNLFAVLKKAMKYDSFACAGIEGTTESVDKNTGLVSAHAYAVLQVAKVAYRGAYVNLVKLRNPWGSSTEWKGDWSDESHTWDFVSEDVKRSMHVDKDNGQWWMTFDDLSHFFTDLTICTVGPDFDSDGAPTGDRWLRSTINGEWVTGKTAGGSRNDLYSYETNPQYFMELREPDDFDPVEDEPEEEGKCSIVLGLMQEYRRVARSKGVENLYLSVNIFRVSERPTRKLDARYFSRNYEVMSSGSYINRREVTITGLLSPGYYVIVPSTFYASKSGTFLLRIFTEKPVDLEQLH
uniref:Calpain-A-like n=1 Tax=Phallusia mammillata TaxID=59560 RepID=A0A6F9D930_9ASCI|nr:calpain-A-like [Phallusia mammillata]